MPLQGPPEVGRGAGSPSDYELLLTEARERVRQAATEKLLARHGEGEVLRGCTATAEVLRRGVPLLLDATFEDEDLSVRFDALQRAAGESTLGELPLPAGAVPRGREGDTGPAAPARALRADPRDVQGKEPERGVLIHGRGCEVADSN